MPQCSSAAWIRRRLSSLSGGVFPRSKRFTVSALTPAASASSTCDIPSKPRALMTCFARSLIFIDFCGGLVLNFREKQRN